MVDGITTDAGWNALYIDSEQTESESGESTVVEDPSTRETVAHVPHGTEADVDATYEATTEAQESWAEAPPVRRQEVVKQLFQVLNEYEDEIIDLLAHEVGGSRIMGETSIQVASDHASEATMLPCRMHDGYVASNTPGKKNIVQKNPKGVVTVISPWNLPLNLSMQTVVSTVAAGNTVVLKPSTNSPITGGLLFVKLFEKTDLPEGVVNVVTGRGSEIGDRVVGHPESDVVALTDSIEVGKRVSGIAGKNLAVSVIEFDGNNTHVVIEGVDVDRATDTAVFGSFVHQGQVCTSIDRRIVHESVYDEYVEKLTGRIVELPVGSAHEDNTVVGPVIDESQCDKMLDYVGEMAAAGATLETGGPTANLDDVDDSLVIQPAIPLGVISDIAAARNEHFDLVTPVIPFSDIDEAVELTNATEYGLSGSAHAGDLATGKEIALRMETGDVHVNDRPIDDEAHVPFSGTEASGVGAYNNSAFLDEITENKWVSLQHEPHDYPL